MRAIFVLRLLFFGIASTAPIVIAQSAFTATGNMTTPRADHTATLLLNGKVLITGGFSSWAFDDGVATAELYDPSTGTFTATGNMTTARRGHTATLLADGRVLIAGGTRLPTGKAELYDPSNGTFVSTGDTDDVFAGGLTVLLTNGKVLITSDPVAQVFDPTTRTLAATGAYAHSGPAFVSTATLLPEGKVLLTGCVARCTAGVTELYDPDAGTFSDTGSMWGWLNVNTATLLINGKVLFAGNAENDGFPADAEEYDPMTGTFTSLGRTIGPHEFSTATLIPDGTVLITGGQLPGGSGDNGAELYAPTAGTFAFAGSMTTARHSHTATLLPDGTVLIAGGFSGWPQPTFRAEIYRPAVSVPAPVLSSLSQAGQQRQGAILHAGTVQVASSDNPAIAGEALEIYCTGLMNGSAIPPQVAIGGRMAEILFFGDVPGFPGLNQVNIRVPSEVESGPAVPVRLTYIGRPSNEVTIGVQ